MIRAWARGLVAVGLLILPAAAGAQGTLSKAPLAATVTLQWDANPEPDITGYVVLAGAAAGVYTERLEAGLATSYVYRLPNVAAAAYFAVRARTPGGESPPSAEVQYTPDVCALAHPMILVDGADYTRDVLLGRSGRVVLIVSVPAGRRLASIQTTLGGEESSLISFEGSGGTFLGAVRYTPTTIGVLPLIITATDSAGCASSTPATRVVTVHR